MYRNLGNWCETSDGWEAGCYERPSSLLTSAQASGNQKHRIQRNAYQKGRLLQDWFVRAILTRLEEPLEVVMRDMSAHLIYIGLILLTNRWMGHQQYLDVGTSSRMQREGHPQSGKDIPTSSSSSCHLDQEELQHTTTLVNSMEMEDIDDRWPAMWAFSSYFDDQGNFPCLNDVLS